MNSIWLYSWLKSKQTSPKFFFQKGTLLTCLFFWFVELAIALLKEWLEQISTQNLPHLKRGRCFNASDGRKMKQHPSTKKKHQEFKENRINYLAKIESTNLKKSANKTKHIPFFSDSCFIDNRIACVFLKHFGPPPLSSTTLQDFSTQAKASKQLRISAPGHLAWTCKCHPRLQEVKHISNKKIRTLRGSTHFLDASKRNQLKSAESFRWNCHFHTNHWKKECRP